MEEERPAFSFVHPDDQVTTGRDYPAQQQHATAHAIPEHTTEGMLIMMEQAYHIAKQLTVGQCLAALACQLLPIAENILTKQWPSGFK